MSHLLLLVRVADRPGALERVLGLIRRRVLAVRRLSLSVGDGGGVLELALRVDEARTPSERLRAELASLTDVVDVAAEPARPTREMAIVRLRGGVPAGDAWRVLSNGSDGAVVEITGSPEDVDAALARLRADGVLSGAMRSGEVALPGRPATDPPPPDEQRREGL